MWLLSFLYDKAVCALSLVQAVESLWPGENSRSSVTIHDCCQLSRYSFTRELTARHLPCDRRWGSEMSYRQFLSMCGMAHLALFSEKHRLFQHLLC